MKNAIENVIEQPLREFEKVLSIIIPVYNEESTLECLLKKVIHVKLTNGAGKEIIIVNDCSRDKSEAIAKYVIGKHPDVAIKYARHEVNSGKGMAIRTGLQLVTGDYVVIQDADLECDPLDLDFLLSYLITCEKKVVYGSRFLERKNKHSYLGFYLGGRLVSFFANILYGQRLTDEPTCYKMFDTGLLKSIPLQCTGFEFCPEVTAKVSKLGYKIKELPIHYYPRSIKDGKKLKWHDGIKAIWTLLKYRFIK
ncbi:MAG: glycosyltransferase family 2 protein [Dysgonamonadaceae bacterium]|jgi:glycosyltransferase involved in cell wall biosynthesis|nr:glycosyltransferase family 2 protein [Dysgonamonadaceae bacterium]